jgi:hypothetical protein
MTVGSMISMFVRCLHLFVAAVVCVGAYPDDDPTNGEYVLKQINKIKLNKSSVRDCAIEQGPDNSVVHFLD